MIQRFSASKLLRQFAGKGAVFMNTVRLLVTLTAIQLLPALVFAAPSTKPPRQFVSIGTGGVTAVFFLAGNTICQIINRARRKHGIRCTTESTAGTIYNLNTLRNGDMDFGIVQSDGLFHAWKGSGAFEKRGPDRNLRTVLSLHPEALTIVARRDSGIRHFEQLKGRRINIGNPGSGQRGTMLELMKAYDWSEKDFSLSSELKSSEQAEALCDNKIDAFAFTVGHPNGSIREASSLCHTTIIPVTGEKVARLLNRSPYYSVQQIPANLYRGTSQPVETIGLTATLVTSSEQPAEVVYQVTRLIIENLRAFKKLHPVFSTLNKQNMVTGGLAVPLHEGAKRYFIEAGLL